jgi:hypothetical protein
MEGWIWDACKGRQLPESRVGRIPTSPAGPVSSAHDASRASSSQSHGPLLQAFDALDLSKLLSSSHFLPVPKHGRLPAVSTQLRLTFLSSFLNYFPLLVPPSLACHPIYSYKHVHRNPEDAPEQGEFNISSQKAADEAAAAAAEGGNVSGEGNSYPPGASSGTQNTP